MDKKESNPKDSVVIINHNDSGSSENQPEDLEAQWRRTKCLNCGYLYEGTEILTKCPNCGNENPDKFVEVD